MKIAIITDGISPYIMGGMQQHSSSLAKQLVLNGNEVTLYHYVSKGDKKPSTHQINELFFNNEFKFHKVVCLYFPSSLRFPGHYIYNSYRYSKLVYEHLKTNLNNYDFIYSKGFSGWKLIIEKVKNKLPVKIGVKFHGYEMYQYAPNIKIKLQHLMLRYFVKRINLKADAVFSYGNKISKIIKSLGVPNNRIIEAPSAIDKQWISNRKLTVNKPLKFLFVGRFERRKGIYEIHQVIKRMSKTDQNAEFHFVGPIPEKKQLKFDTLKVFYHGIIKDVDQKKQIYDDCDVLLCPSYSEGMPNVILEAMSRGLIIIGSNTGAVSSLVSNKNGVILESLNIESLLQAVTILFQKNNYDLISMKTESRNIIFSEFTWDKITLLLENKISRID